jgi:hypothetical protein
LWVQIYCPARLLTTYQQIDPEDIAVMDSMLPANGGERRTIADMIFAKLESDDTSAVKKVHQGHIFCCMPSQLTDALCWIDREHHDPAFGIDQKVVDAYSKYVSPTIFHSFTISTVQSWSSAQSIQIRTSSEALQVYSFSARVGTNTCTYQPGSLDSACMPGSYTLVHLQFETTSSSIVSTRGTLRRC